MPSFTPGTFNSFTIIGEAPACTQIIGNFAGYLFDTGTSSFSAGGFIIENLHFVNSYNAAPYTSGCIRMGGIAPTVRNCWFGGMVGVNFSGAVAPRLCDTYMQSSLPNPPGVGSIGVLLAGDGGVVENFSGSGMEVCIALSGTGQSVHGCHFEVSRRGVVAGFSASSLGLGYSRGVAVQGVSCEAVGIPLDIAGPTVGYFNAVAGQLHQSTNVNPNPASAYPDRALWGLRVQNGTAESLTIIDCGGGSSADIDPAGGSAYIGTLPTGLIRSGGCFISFLDDTPTANVTETWTLPGSANGGTAVAGAANCARLMQCNRSLVWSYNDLPWGTLTSASISGTTLTYSAATRLTLEVGAVLKGTGVTAGTKVTAILSSTSATVTPSQTASSGTYTFFCNNPGDTYEIKDSTDAIWTGSVSNAGKPITTGGGSNRVTVLFKETVGYVLVG